jgi:hypothetical protein
VETGVPRATAVVRGDSCGPRSGDFTPIVHHDSLGLCLFVTSFSKDRVRPTPRAVRHRDTLGPTADQAPCSSCRAFLPRLQESKAAVGWSPSGQVPSPPQTGGERLQHAHPRVADIHRRMTRVPDSVIPDGGSVWPTLGGSSRATADKCCSSRAASSRSERAGRGEDPLSGWGYATVVGAGGARPGSCPARCGPR